jgi:hypothetical protein
MASGLGGTSENIFGGMYKAAKVRVKVMAYLLRDIIEV